MEQMQQFSNRFFLFMSLLQQFPGVSPLGRYTTIIPLSFIMTLSGIKSIYDDKKRCADDNEINHRCVEVLRNGLLVREKWDAIGVGDILKINNDSIFPADMILISSSELHGICYIETMDLDGETNFKTRQSLDETAQRKELNELRRFNGVIECELPNKQLYEFVGSIKIQSNQDALPLGPKQLLLRGAVLRNVKWIYGVVIYTGHETKTMLNQIKTTVKQSKVDAFLNCQMKIMFQCIFLACLLCTVCCALWSKKMSGQHWYLNLSGFSFSGFLLQIVTFFILFHNAIPISLQVYVESVRWIEAWFINNDIDMYHKESNTPAVAKSPNLNEELGQVKFIFSDKTGTLTRNIMELKHCSIAGELYLEGSQDILKKNTTGHSTRVYIREFLRTLTVCHTAIPEQTGNDGTIVYKASSPDELALLNGSQKLGFVFHTRLPKSVSIAALGVDENYEILNILEFTSARKRMSVIVRTPDSKIRLYCKGADTAIFQRLSKTGKKYAKQTTVHLNTFANEGLRTLCYAYVDVSESFYASWKSNYLKASTVLQNRDAAKDRVAGEIEKDMILTGATAIEDKLQNNVPETIRALLNANINIWMLTGDKQETAVNIGTSTNLIKKGTPLIIINEPEYTDCKKTIYKHIRQLGRDMENPSNSRTLVIDGQSLKHALSYDIKKDFLELCISFKTLICCRLTPLQKAEVVELVTKHTNDVTLAIGDGANDVPMIKKANIGIGISGLEGLQAACAADYSIAQFEYLSKLLFVHGAWNHDRVSKMIYYCYYKNICFYILQLWFAMYSGWSGKILFDRWIICSYNVFFTAAPPLALGIFSTKCSAKTRMKYPDMYSQSVSKLNAKTFWTWVFNGMAHSFLIFWSCVFMMGHETVWINGKIGDYSVLGNTVYTCVLVVACLKAGLHVQSWTYIVHLTIWPSILSWFVFIIIYSRLAPTLYHFGVTTHLNDAIILRAPTFWTTLVFFTVFPLLFDATVIIITRVVYKSITQSLGETDVKIHKLKKNNTLC
ncbi:phospholipid-transporting ATPase IA-like isoform X2 [Adelges cooleyi]|nr:phospholipid-transporting ATPase IA-like isoform X2 [Adelges cooleyi]